jgi:hypothetical protein
VLGSGQNRSRAHARAEGVGVRVTRTFLNGGVVLSEVPFSSLPQVTTVT